MAEQTVCEYLARDEEVPNIGAAETLAADGASTGLVEWAWIGAVASILEG